LRDVPLFYPFVVNDPGRGRRPSGGRTRPVVDHLIPPMTRADTYDDLAKLEQLLDEYYQVETLDPSKLPAIRVRIWETLRDAELHRDLGVEEQPEEFGDFLNHVDGYLCEIKDLPIRGGPPRPRRPPNRRTPAPPRRLHPPDRNRTNVGLRQAVGSAYGLDEKFLSENGGARVGAPEKLAAPLPWGGGPPASDLLDRLEEATQALFLGLEPDSGTWRRRRGSRGDAGCLELGGGAVAAVRGGGGRAAPLADARGDREPVAGPGWGVRARWAFRVADEGSG
jgi:cobaltochelatase CobN